MYITLKQLENLAAASKPGKVVVIYGARRTGKTTLIKEFLKTENVQPLANFATKEQFIRLLHDHSGASVAKLGLHFFNH